MPKESEAAKRKRFDETALPHLDRVYSSALYLTRDPAAAQDLTQDAFLRAFRFFHQYQDGTNCRAWLLTILQNTFRNRYRSEKRFRANVDIDDPVVSAEASQTGDPVPGPEAAAVAGALDDEVVAALEALAPDYRQVVLLVDVQELSYEEAAEVLDCPIGTVRSRLSRARRQLAESLASYARDRGRA